MAMETIEREFREFLARRQEATRAFFNGDPGPWKELAARDEQITMFGGYGGYERGWEAVEDRYDWASARNAEAKIDFTLLACRVTPAMAYTVTLERGIVRPSEGGGFAPRALRVTEIFMRDSSDWRLVHRHADPLVAVR